MRGSKSNAVPSITLPYTHPKARPLPSRDTNRLCMPYNPDKGNTESWRFRCSCTFGKWVDPASTPLVFGDQDALCTTRNYSPIQYILSIRFK